MEQTIRQKDLAHALDLTQSTVSRALRGDPVISRRVRERVLEAARERGYELPGGLQPSAILQTNQRTGIICADIPRADEWHERLLDGIIAAAAETGHEIITAVHTRGALPAVVTRSHVDGLIRLMSQDDYAQNVQPVPEAPVPTVSILYPVPGADVVNVDHFDSARKLGLHVGRKNHRIAAYIGHGDPIGRARFGGFRCGLEECGGCLPMALVRILRVLDPEQVVRFVEELLALRAEGRPEEQFSVIGLYNDHLAAHAVETIRARGLRVPEDVSVVGYDDVELPIAHDLKLTTVHLPLEELGAEAVRRIQWRMSHPGEPPLHWVLETHVAEGESVAVREAQRAMVLAGGQ